MYGSARSVGKVEPSNQSPGRSPRLPRSPRLGHRRTNSTGGSSGSSVGGSSGKTLSMENIQSLNAAYATSGPMYLSDHENVGSETPKSTMTLGRSGGRLPYGVRMTAMGSSPNIASSGVASDTIAFGEHHLPPVSMASTVPHSLRQARDNTIMDLQTQLKEVLRENDLLRKDVEVKESKLSSSMNSIKTFWSPELKKERALRKDEASKITIWKEQYRVVQEENQHMQMTIQALQDELRIQRDLNQLFQQDSNSRTGEPCVAELTEENFQRLHAEHERQAKELFLLRKTLEEMELRIETQKQTLNARDESIKKLLEMLQSKGLSAKATEEDHERTRRLAEAEMHVHHLESLLEQKEKENSMLREEMHRRFENAPDSAKTKALQTVIEMKDSKISSMERGLRDLEEEIQMLKSNGALSTEEREEEMKQMEVYRSHSKFMKNKVEQLKEELSSKEAQGEELKKRAAGLQAEIGQVKQELSRKDTELLALQTKLETLTNQFSDSKQHIEVLKESLTAKEQRAAILQTEVDALRLRLEEKETMLNKKTKQIQDMAEEKGTQAGEIHDLKDMLDVKERKVNVLQKKIENLQEQLRDKEKQMSSLKERVKSLQADTTNTDTALTTLEEALAEKERTIERLKEQRDRDEREKQEEIDNYKKDLKDLKEKVSLLQGDLSEKEASLLDLKEHASSLASSGLKKDSRLKTLEIALEQKKEECLKMESQLKKAHEATLEARASPEMSDRIQQLEREIARYKDESSKAQAEVDRLLEILKEVENEKNDKDKKIAELERQVKDQNKKVANLKHKEQVEKKKSAQMLEEARRREDNLNDSSQQLQDSLRKKDDRIEELEEALRESVQITAEREMVLAQEESARTSAEKQVEELLMAMEKVKQELESMKAKLSSTQQSLAEKETHLTNLRAERRKHLEEVLEMKQEALLAAISEKDANIALLELSSSKKKTQEEVAALKREKDRLVQQLKQQTQNRMKLMADNYEDDHFKSSHSNQTNHKPSPDQIIQPLLELDQNRSKLKLYIGHLTALCHDRDPLILRGLTPPASYNLDDDQATWENELQKMTQEQLQNELEKGERDNAELQEFANALLQQIADHCPDILEQVVNALEESS
ncbi:ELKS/Rab6-interacting/CAST family member 1 isoform X2 [Ursus maritimus]|uniref:ELKS/Rab6-interacting/CAST family member 1 isoform X2 n=1 Tax=Ursus maritimus TaxID=29073 RepID=A0A8M1GT32_URSMA|nr:ELKS/Rab6-interacting/CAST family member 1 isoform X2 [Ursus arctos]XP_040497942.1 ELKS/Rab6-interacting/CAST family member 1 isoform X2 [Ursus maritimus]XP_048072706.1 ELKS/Rab6-interacting/CAST family member 1 isoform X2 [Ursus arctos]XP_048072707.1 ELKS/Rab6-interacting/CAST family member 1 isoform X2 [Ursus arctos]XP_057174928.1 ELKS/Rab6-interacting/CAST family member 1 isoform X2 [Ursus arctos]XP_057174929.1 ELKS/Rab6-interacting/CAST family member 1 isoform X2 [Ursus arctos]